ncbi:MAG: adenylosuccinate synthase [Candidatus Sericytochromatia bacterium]|nr:adenylosuccinate synthase [Candidatus Sericytochromatia bacterium]
MATVVVVGAQWGDEGKGKVTDVLAAQADVVVRFQGGANAGHTVIVGQDTFKLHLVPSGILHPGVRCVLGAGVVIDPPLLIAELEGLQARGVPLGALTIAGGAHVTMPWHRRLDAAEERQRGAAALGTTGRGIGPTYTDKVARAGIRMVDLLSPDRLRTRVQAVLPGKNALLSEVHGEVPLSVDEIVEAYGAYGARLRPWVGEAAAVVSGAVRAGRAVLLEGAQGTMLDLDAGTYPFVTSSHPVAAGACLGTGLGPTAIDRVLGVTKAYTTRVGAGPFPTEDLGALGARLRDAGGEYGTTTGRPRRCGWFDAVVVRHAARVNGLDALAVTKLDVLDGFEQVSLCTAYRLGDTVLEELPDDPLALAACEPVLENLPGWGASTGHARTLAELPAGARAYLARLEAATGVPIAMVGVGADRAATLVLKELLRGPRRRLVEAP